MDAGAWTEDEWGALTEGDTPPEVAPQPWGRPLKETHGETLKDADYIARKLLDFGVSGAGPLGWFLNYLVPHPQPGSETMQTAAKVGDDVGAYLGPLLGLLMSRGMPYYHGGWKKDPDTRDRLKTVWTDPPWKMQDPEPYPGVRTPPIGGTSGQGKSLEEILRHRAPIDMSDEAMEAMIQQRLKQAGIPYQGPGTAPPRPSSPPMPWDDEVLDTMLRRWKERYPDPAPARTPGSFTLPPLPGD